MCANGLNGQPCWAGRYNSLRKRPTRKPKTGHSITIYYYLDRHGRHPIQLGRDWQEVEERLFLSQKEKEILAFNQDATPLERLEERLRQMGKMPRHVHKRKGSGAWCRTISMPARANSKAASGI